MEHCATLFSALQAQWTHTRAKLDGDHPSNIDEDAVGTALHRLAVLLELTGDQIAAIEDLIPPPIIIAPRWCRAARSRHRA